MSNNALAMPTTAAAPVLSKNKRKARDPLVQETKKVRINESFEMDDAEASQLLCVFFNLINIDVVKNTRLSASRHTALFNSPLCIGGMPGDAQPSSPVRQDSAQPASAGAPDRVGDSLLVHKEKKT